MGLAELRKNLVAAADMGIVHCSGLEGVPRVVVVSWCNCSRIPEFARTRRDVTLTLEQGLTTETPLTVDPDRSGSILIR